MEAEKLRSKLMTLKNTLNTRQGFFWWMIALFWLKTYLVYQTKFSLGIKNGMQQFLLVLNPLPIAILLFGIGLYFRGKKVYWYFFIVNLILSLWLFANVLYYREFSDFLSFSIMKSSGSVSNNLGLSISQIINPTDFLVFLDIIVMFGLLVFRVIKVDYTPVKWLVPVTFSLGSVLLFAINLTLADIDRPQLLTRTFDNNYIVKYLGIDFFAGYSAYQTHKQDTTRSQATAADLKKVLQFINQNRTQANISYYGKAKGKNVFIFHLESFQQFLIGYKVNGKEVTPNINKFYHDAHTLSFDNFYNQVGQGKTSDAETMLENSLFGLSSGSVMTSYGTSNTFQAMPAIMNQHGYTTAAFHGDTGSFWNRDNTYKSWGYDYFFSESYYKVKNNYISGYGLKDKIFLKDSVSYLQKLPQPFYAKIITVTNHYPYEIDAKNQTIAKTTTGDTTVDGYVQTAHYLDQAFGEFISYLKKTGLYNNSMIVAYGDHYGISTNHKKAIAQLLGKSSVSSYDLINWEKVPFMVRVNTIKGGINHTYGGEIDVMPTLLDLLGIKNTNTVQLGQDLLSKNRKQIVAFRDGNWTSPTMTKVGSTYYNSKGQDITNTMTAAQKKYAASATNYVDELLSNSDEIIEGDLLRFYNLKGFTKVNRSDYSYNFKSAIEKLNAAQSQKTSLYAKKGDTTNLYSTDAPELSSSSSSSSSSSASSSKSNSSSSSSSAKSNAKNSSSSK